MKYLYVLPFGSIEEPVLHAIERTAAETFGGEIKRLPPAEEPSSGFDPQSRQYSASTLLRHLINTTPADAVKIVGVTRYDLFIPMLSFVFGFAQVNGPAAVISLARLRQEFYSLPANVGLLSLRAAKEAVHELGHCFGLFHCPDRSCAMALSTTVQGVDGKLPDLCPACSMMLSDHVSQLLRTNGTENEQ